MGIWWYMNHIHMVHFLHWHLGLPRSSRLVYNNLMTHSRCQCCRVKVGARKATGLDSCLWDVCELRFSMTQVVACPHMRRTSQVWILIGKLRCWLRSGESRSCVVTTFFVSREGIERSWKINDAIQWSNQVFSQISPQLVFSQPTATVSQLFRPPKASATVPVMELSMNSRGNRWLVKCNH